MNRKPVHIGRSGNVTIPVARDGPGRYAVIWRKHEGAERTKERFTDKLEACERADEIAKAVSNGQADALELTGADRDTYRLVLQRLAPLGVPLLSAIDEYCAARKAIGAHTLMEAANFFARGYTQRLACPSSSIILEQLVAQLIDDRRELKRYIQPLKKDCEPFAKKFPDLLSVTEEDVREYLRGLVTARPIRCRLTREMVPAGAPVSARRRDNVRDALLALFRFAQKKKYLPKGETPPELVPHIHIGAEVTTYSPEEVEQILTYFAKHDSTWLPWAAIGALGGMRSSEILRLSWESVKWDVGTIAVSSRVAKKVRVSRQVPLLPALRAWLQPWRNATGPVIARRWQSMEMAHTRALGRMRASLGWKGWSTNALRHGFGSNRLAVVKDIAQVALELGNSPAKVREDYNDPKPEADAVRYFAVMPPAELDNVIPFKKAG